jgi:WD40 repeat protein/energy-coupling factor transporter ATP-binding protein EcfA2
MPDRNIIIKPNPFPGLRAFRPDEGHLFFGRMESTIKVVSRLKENRFVAVLGASGSGKSSLVLSGVLPALLKENAEEKKSWSYLVFRPALNPVDQLAAELSAMSAGAGFNPLTKVSVAASLHNRTEGLSDVINRIRKNLRQEIVIVIDQFEEIFRFSQAGSTGTPGDDTTDFIDLIVSAAQKPDQGLYIILTLRSEYVSECARYHSLTNLMNSSSYLLPQIAHDLLGTVIEEPVKLTGGAIDRSLVKLILSDLDDRPGQLPVLQHLLMRMWNQWSRMGDLSRTISVADYEAAGRLKGAISRHAGQALESLDERHRYVCSRLFRTITVRTDDGRELRKPERISTIAAQTGCSETEIISVAEVFRAPEYSFLTPSKEIPLNGESILDLTHESIIRLWSTLRRWMDEEEASVRIYRQLAVAAEQYQEGNGRLWTPPDLLLALRWREENAPALAWAEKIDPAFERAMLFLKNSEEEYNIQEEYDKKSGTISVRRSRLVAGFLGLMVLLALIALGTVFSLRNRAERQKAIAIQMKDEAIALSERLTDSIEILASAVKTVSGTDEALLSEEAFVQTEGRAANVQSMMKKLARQKDAALEEATETNRSRMLTLARSLALRSLNHSGNKDLQILLARQAYLFNQKYAGIEEDADVFAGLYDVCLQYGNRFCARFGPDGARITAMAEGAGGEFYTADEKGRVLSWKADQPARGYKIVWSGNRMIRSMAVSPDASWLACGTYDAGILMIPIDDDTIGYQMNDSSGSVTSVLWPDNRHLYTSSSEGAVTEWDLRLRTGKRVLSNGSGISALEISGGNTMLAALTEDGQVIYWRTGSAGKYSSLAAGEKILTAHKFMPGGERLLTGDNKGVINVWNTTTGLPEGTATGHIAAVRSIAFDSIDGQMLTADDAGEIRLWTMTNLAQPPVIFTDGQKNVIRLAFSDGGDAFLSAAGSDVIRRPAHIRCMVDGLCEKVTRNLTEQEWSAFVGQDVVYEPTCPDRDYQIRVREIRGAR